MKITKKELLLINNKKQGELLKIVNQLEEKSNLFPASKLLSGEAFNRMKVKEVEEMNTITDKLIAEADLFLREQNKRNKLLKKLNGNKSVDVKVVNYKYPDIALSTYTKNDFINEILGHSNNVNLITIIPRYMEYTERENEIVLYGKQESIIKFKGENEKLYKIDLM